MSQIRYKIDIYARGVISTTGTISWTFTENRFPEDYTPVIGGQIARPTEGIVENQPWVLSIVDVGSSFTGLLSSSGRLQHIGRLVRTRISYDSTASTAYRTIDVGRIADIQLNPSVAAYDLTMTGENWMAQQLQVFAKVNSDVSIIPGGLVRNAPKPWIQFPNGDVQWTALRKYGRTTLLAYADSRSKAGMDSAVGALIASDIKPGTPGGAAYPLNSTAFLASFTTGVFKHIRFRNVATSADLGIVAFGAEIGIPLKFNFPTAYLAAAANGWDPGDFQMNFVWTVWSSTAAAPSSGTKVRGYVHAGGTYTVSGVAMDAGLVPSPALPLLIGGVNGLHPSDVAKNSYNGVYSPSTATQVMRFSSTAMDRWKKQSVYGRLWYRITSPMNMMEFLAESIYKPYGMIPALDSSGKIAPKSVLAPSSQAVGTLANVLRLTSTNLASHPTWGSQSRELINVIEAKADDLYAPLGGGLDPSKFRYPSADRLFNSTKLATRIHDNTTMIGRRALRVRYPHATAPIMSTGNTAVYLSDFEAFTSGIARHYFSRFGDGPLYSDVMALPSIDLTTRGTMQVGGYVAMNLGTYPNVGTNTRGSTRLMQIVGRRNAPNAIALTLLDGGAAQSPLSVPSFSMALSSQSSRHGVKTIVSAVTAGASYEIRAAPTSTGAAAPSDDSTLWRTIIVGTSANLTQHFLRLASKTKWWSEARQVKTGRTFSAWSTMQSVVTATIPNVSGLAFSTAGQGAGRVLFKWANGSSVYGVQINVSDTTALFTVGSSNLVAMTGPRTTQYQITDITPANGIRASVRPFDAYGGIGVGASLSYKPGSTASAVAPSMKGIAILQGKP